MQDPLYHLFADRRSMLGLSNALDVLSNLPFILIGFYGLWRSWQPGRLCLLPRIGYLYRIFFTAVILIGLGSWNYHLQPDNHSLVWDRLPMTLAFMAFFSIVLAEYISVRIAVLLFPWLAFCGLFSVAYWAWTESLGQGDLRLYLLVQFLPVLLTPLILRIGRSPFDRSGHYWLIIACYLVAKLFEYLDAELFELLTLVSGHTLKHLTSGLAVAVFVHMLLYRCQRAPTDRQGT